MIDLPFAYRVIVLVVLLAIVAAIEWLLRRERATRWREYSFLGALAGIGGVFGALNDAATVRLSPEYFAYFKDLGWSAELRSDAMVLGSQAGLSAGVALGAVYLIAVPRGDDHLTIRRLLQLTTWTISGAIGLSVLGALVLRAAAQHGAVSPVDGLDAAQSLGFYTVWGAHIGLYVGAFLAVTFAIVHARREAKTSPT